MWTFSKTKLIIYIKIFHCKVLFQFFYNTKKITYNVVYQGGQVEGAKFVTWKTTKVCQVSSFLALTFDVEGGGVESTTSPYFICENNRKRNKIKHCLMAKELINPSTFGRRVSVHCTPPPHCPYLGLSIQCGCL